MTVYARPGADGALMSFDARYDNFIGGQWADSHGGETFETHSPVDNSLLTTVASGDASDSPHTLAYFTTGC